MGKQTKNMGGGEQHEVIDIRDVTLLHGCCCYNTSFYGCNCEVCGCSGRQTCCCLQQQFCCKLGHPLLCCGAPEGVCCQIGCGICSYGCINENIACISGQSQTFCCVHSCSFPFTEQVPCTMAFCGAACCPSCGCCKTLAELEGKAGADAGGAATVGRV